MLFAEHSSSYLQSLMDHFANTCTVIGLTISLKKFKVLAQATTSSKIINNYELAVVDKFIYLRSTIMLSLDRELDRRIGMTNFTLARLGTRVWKQKPDYLSRRRSQFITLVLLVHFYKETNAGLHMLLKSVD